MSAETEPCLAVDGSDRIDRARLTWPKRITIAFALLGLYTPFFLDFLFPSDAMFLLIFAVSAVSAVPLAVFSLQALLRRRWKVVSIYALVWTLLCVPFTGTVGLHEWLRTLGFYVHKQSIDGYRSVCQLTEFIEDGVKQTAGTCEAFDRGEYYEFVIYDTTGEFMRPVSQRSPEWTRAIEGTILEAVVRKEGRAYPLFDNYYVVTIYRRDIDGCPPGRDLLYCGL